MINRAASESVEPDRRPGGQPAPDDGIPDRQNLRPLAEDMVDKAQALRDLQRQPNPDTTGRRERNAGIRGSGEARPPRGRS